MCKVRISGEQVARSVPKEGTLAVVPGVIVVGSILVPMDMVGDASITHRLGNGGKC